MRKVQIGDVISIHCVGRISSGEVFEDTYQGDPFVFEVGSPEIIPGLSEAVIGMVEGEEKEIIIPKNKAFGERDENLIRSIPREAIALDVDPTPGLVLNLVVDTPQGEMTFPAIVVDATPQEIVLDLNPPLAGEDLYFKIRLVKILNESEEKIIL
ncbi:MAG: peptidylprolyl isomerase [Caldimicrobium sp.]|nr:peptidylprolyl isomerase [Caldimicrobium sp.]MCX7612608.1 peptidylprolyl isomerase [Caldimicrobium sp.]MDW8182239.1 peptidylprolyl isomerase [Caldimicrobium sp.]